MVVINILSNVHSVGLTTRLLWHLSIEITSNNFISAKLIKSNIVTKVLKSLVKSQYASISAHINFTLRF